MSLDYSSNLSYGQKKRLNKINIEKFYLIDKKVDDSKLTWMITGSTFNIYNVTADLKYNNLRCNCQDFSSWAKKENCMCKHCCFVIVKVLKEQIDLPNSNIFNLKTFSDLEMSNILHNFKSEITHNNDDEYKLVLERYNKMIVNEVKPSKFEIISKKSQNCPICYEDIKDIESSLACPDCKNSFHKNCIEMWLKTGSNNCCPYCRSETWDHYIKQNLDYRNIFIN